MVTSFRPPGVRGFGKLSVVLIPAVVDPAGPTVAEIDAGLEIACTLRRDGGITPSTEVSSVTDSRLCDDRTYETMDEQTPRLGDLMYIIDPQDTAADGNNRVYLQLTPDTYHYVVMRWGVDYGTAYAAAQVVDMYYIQAGPQTKNPLEQGKMTATQQTFVQGSWLDVAVVA